MFYQIIERSVYTGAIAKIYSGYETEEQAQEDCEALEELEENECYWYEVTPQ